MTEKTGLPGSEAVDEPEAHARSRETEAGEDQVASSRSDVCV